MQVNPALQEILQKGTVPHRQLLGTRYTVISVIGRGVSGDVLLVADNMVDGAVAVVKSVCLLGADTPQDPVARQQRVLQAISEARIMSMFKDDGIVRLLDLWFEETDSSIRFLMEYCSGGDLETYMRCNFPLKEDVLASILIQCLLVVAHIHTKGVAHRDLKPSNILLTGMRRGGRSDPGSASTIPERRVPALKLADFGLSAHCNEGTATKTPLLIGTPLFMSPETVSKGVCDFGSDIWSLGVVFYRLMTNTFPFVGNDMESLHLSILQHNPPHPKSRSSQRYSEELGDLVMRMLVKNPCRRPSARQLISSPLFRQPLFHSPWRSRALYKATCFFVCHTDCRLDVFAEPHLASSVVASLGYGDHIFLTGDVLVRTSLKSSKHPSTLIRSFSWDPKSSETEAFDRMFSPCNQLEGCGRHPNQNNNYRNLSRSEKYHVWGRVVWPRIGYCAMYEQGCCLLKHVGDCSPCGPLFAATRDVVTTRSAPVISVTPPHTHGVSLLPPTTTPANANESAGVAATRPPRNCLHSDECELAPVQPSTESATRKKSRKRSLRKFVSSFFKNRG
ncbi:putative protein kinase [Trypanosoma vivax]|nr:putative protein kinase [Trypanosoma vivax]